jgi:3-oxoadipate enol-lactonase/4-carboxymuconolactone decarboxylase
MTKDTYDAGMKVRREVLSPEHVERSTQNADSFTREFQEFFTRYAWGEIWTRDGLDRKSRSLINLAMLTALNRPDEFRLHVKAAIRNGVTPDEIKEVLLQTAVYAGVPAAHSAFKWAREVLTEMGVEL